LNSSTRCFDLSSTSVCPSRTRYRNPEVWCSFSPRREGRRNLYYVCLSTECSWL
jgi:hypothetical protein